jgi:peptide chain release factor 1
LDFWKKLEQLAANQQEIARKLSNPEIARDREQFTRLSREHSRLEPIVAKYRELEQLTRELEETRVLLGESDEELRELARAELPELEEQSQKLTEELRALLIPRDPNDSRNVIMEIRAGTGGDEAALFAADLFRMYQKYAESQGWKVEPVSSSASGAGGLKEVVFGVRGREVYAKLKYEAGVHRVQRVPVTESSGRIHTSAASVAVLPEAEEVDVEINPKDLRIDVYRASGHGGQSVNTTDSAVRITHLPTGIEVTCQDERSQIKNKEKALKVLWTRLYERKLAEENSRIESERRSQVLSGDRSVKIRTYNFPQGRVTDHRINLTLYRLEEILNGSLEELIGALRLADNTEKLKRETQDA